MPRKQKTHEQFVKELSDKNSNIEVVGLYAGAHSSIKCQCKVCGHIWDPPASKILNGTGCPMCFIERRRRKISRTHNEFVDILKEKSPNIEIIGEYKGNKDYVLCRCRICGHEWECIPSNLLLGHQCPECNRLKQKKLKAKSHDDFILEMSQKHPNIEVLSEYQNQLTPVLFRCRVCETKWEVTPACLLKKHATGCPHCNQSVGERFIAEYLQSNDIEYKKYQKYLGLLGVGGRLLSYDFYLPIYNTLIEFQGEQHYRPVRFGSKTYTQEKAEKRFQIQLIHDERKREYAKVHNIHLLEISYKDINNINKILHSYFAQKVA